jgi:CRISPR-associated protein Cas2
MSDSGKTLYWVAYDIRCPKRWRRVFETLKGFGSPVQFSIFACSLTTTQLASLIDALKQAMNLKEDRAALIPLCQHCRQHVECLGTQEWVTQEQPFIF